jgi:hypothetical protein
LPRLTVSNEGPPIERFVLSGACDDADFGPIPTDTTVERQLNIVRGGELAFDAARDGDQIRGVIQGYVTPSQRVRLLLKFDTNGFGSVRPDTRPDIFRRAWANQPLD